MKYATQAGTTFLKGPFPTEFGMLTSLEHLSFSKWFSLFHPWTNSNSKFFLTPPEWNFCSIRFGYRCSLCICQNFACYLMEKFPLSLAWPPSWKHWFSVRGYLFRKRLCIVFCVLFIRVWGRTGNFWHQAWFYYMIHIYPPVSCSNQRLPISRGRFHQNSAIWVL